MPTPHPKTPYATLAEYRVGLSKTCGPCHQQEEADWEQSVHGKAVAGGQTAALCSDCHQPHGTVEPSLVALFTTTCVGCHQEVVDSYLKSVHGQAVLQGSTDAATCVDCHSWDRKAHTLQASTEAGSPSSPEEIPLTCGRCHPEPMANFESTFHGRDWKLGVKGEGPTCIDCHGSFGILPAHGAETSMTEERLSTICGKCHQGITASFAQGWPGHEEPSPTHFAPAYYTERFLIYLTAGAMAFGILHVELDLLRWWTKRRRGRAK
jgi:predicted CXXCH cytochrome family protein